MIVTSSIQSSLINLYIWKCLTQFIKCQKLFDFLDCTHSVRCFQIASKKTLVLIQRFVEDRRLVQKDQRLV